MKKKIKKKELLKKANRIVAPYGLRAEIFKGIISTGVTGDKRSRTPVINLVGLFPGYDVLTKVSNEITNSLEGKINRVTFQTAQSPWVFKKSV